MADKPAGSAIPPATDETMVAQYRIEVAKIEVVMSAKKLDYAAQMVKTRARIMRQVTAIVNKIESATAEERPALLRQLERISKVHERQVKAIVKPHFARMREFRKQQRQYLNAAGYYEIMKEAERKKAMRRKK